MNPDSVRSETFSRLRIWKNHSGSRSEQLRILNEFKVKLLWKTGKIWQFLHKNAQFININTFLSNNIPLKSLPISRHIKQPNSLTRQEYKGEIYIKNIIFLNPCRIRNQLKSRIRIRKKSSRIHNTEKKDKQNFRRGIKWPPCAQERSPSPGSDREVKRGRKEKGRGRRSWSHSPIHKSRKHRSRSRDRLSSSSKHRSPYSSQDTKFCDLNQGSIFWKIQNSPLPPPPLFLPPPLPPKCEQYDLTWGWKMILKNNACTAKKDKKNRKC